MHGCSCVGGAALPVLELATLMAKLVIIPLGTEPLPRLSLMLEEWLLLGVSPRDGEVTLIH